MLVGQIHRHFDDPKPSYVAEWDDLPVWQQESDADIFEHIESRISQVVVPPEPSGR